MQKDINIQELEALKAKVKNINLKKVIEEKQKYINKPIRK